MGVLVRGLAPDGSLKNVGALIRALTEYSQLIDPWAQAVSGYMLADVARKDAKMWREHSRDMGVALRREIENAPTGDILRQLQAEQVHLIKSIPLDAAQRVHDLAMEATITSTRASEIAKAILSSESVSESKARTIARTEVSRAASNLVEARSTWAGSDGYIWRTSGDSDVRPSHAAMEGKYVRWSSPPRLDNMVGHAGCFPNCRCFSEPLFPDD